LKCKTIENTETKEQFTLKKTERLLEKKGKFEYE
jgi:hypothetical protein